jgi:hypothetical protein
VTYRIIKFSFNSSYLLILTCSDIPSLSLGILYYLEWKWNKTRRSLRPEMEEKQNNWLDVELAL